MKDKNMNAYNEIPSKKKLIKSTILAVLIAAVILLMAVLPAEYGIDPTGVGDIIGLKRMGEIKVSLAGEASLQSDTAAMADLISREKAENAVSETTYAEKEVTPRSDKFTITLEPNEGKEIKLTMLEGNSINYLWYTDGGIANFDTHADSKELEIKYHNYEKGRIERKEGVLVAAFTGNHGWFWRNRTSRAMVVTLEVNGVYTKILKF